MAGDRLLVCYVLFITSLILFMTIVHVYNIAFDVDRIDCNWKHTIDLYDCYVKTRSWLAKTAAPFGNLSVEKKYWGFNSTT